jgi:hypothetical protein
MARHSRSELEGSFAFDGYGDGARGKIIAELRSTLSRHPDDFAEGFRDWLIGEDTLEAEAAGSIFAETVLLHRFWLKAQQQDGKARRSR